MDVYFISGVCGVGKSTLIPHLRNLLPADKYVVRDFDARGVPDGADHAWRKSEASLWLEEAARTAAEGKETVICGFVKPGDFEGLINEHMPTVKIIVLDADEDTIRQRLTKRYTKDGVFDDSRKVIGKPVNDFIASNVWYAKTMREESFVDGHPVVDTSSLTPREVAEKVARLIKQHQ